MKNIPFDVSPVWSMIDKVIEQQQANDIITNNCSKFLINYLVQSKKDIVNITGLTLKLNSIDFSIKGFMKKQWCVEAGYIEIVRQKENSVRLKLTDMGRLMADTFPYTNPIVKRTYLKRLTNSIRVAFNVTKVLVLVLVLALVSIYLFSLLFTPKAANIIIEIAAVCTILTFIYLLLNNNNDSKK